MIVLFTHDSKKSKQLIIALLKAGLATEIKRLNYIKSYSLQDNKVVSQQEKALLISFLIEKKQALETMIKKLDKDAMYTVI